MMIRRVQSVSFVSFLMGKSSSSIFRMEKEAILVEINDKDEEKPKPKQSKDLEFLSCMMQPATAESDPQYIGIRRILLHRKSESGAISRRYVSSLSLSNLSLESLLSDCSFVEGLEMQWQRIRCVS